MKRFGYAVFAIILLSCEGEEKNRTVFKNLTRQFDQSLIFNAPMNRNQLIRERSWKHLRSGNVDSSVILAARLIRESELGNVPPEIKVDAYAHMGQISGYLNSRTHYRWNIEKALDLYNHYGFETSGYERDLYSLLAGTYYVLEDDFQKALEYYNKAYEIARKLNNDLYGSSMLNNMGLTYLKLEEYNLARDYFLKAQSILDENDLLSDELSFSIVNNLGKVNYLKGLYVESVDCYHRNYEKALEQLPGDSSVEKRLVTSNIGQAYASVALKQWEKTSDHLSVATEHINSVPYNERLNLILEILQLKRQASLTRGQVSELMPLTDSISKVMEQIHHNEIVARDLATRRMLDLQLESASMSLAEQQQAEKIQRQRNNFNWLLTVSILIFLVLVSAFLIALSRRRNKSLKTERLLMRANLKNLQLEEETLRLKVAHQSSDLRALAGHNTLLRDLADEVKSKLAILGDNDAETQRVELKKLNTSLAIALNDDKVQDILRENLDKVNTSFYAKLDEVSQQKLSRGEKEICALARLHLSTQQIAELRRTEPGTIRVARHRIKKKLNLSKNEDLQTYLEQLH